MVLGLPMFTTLRLCKHPNWCPSSESLGAKTPISLWSMVHTLEYFMVVKDYKPTDITGGALQGGAP
jgi:hypothetical protein